MQSLLFCSGLLSFGSLLRQFCFSGPIYFRLIGTKNARQSSIYRNVSSVFWRIKRWKRMTVRRYYSSKAGRCFSSPSFCCSVFNLKTASANLSWYKEPRALCKGLVSLFRLYAYHDPDLMKQFLQAPETSIQQKSAEAGRMITAERCDSPTVRNGGNAVWFSSAY